MGSKTVEQRGPTEALTQTVEEERAHVVGLVDSEMSHFRMVVSSAFLANEVQVSEAIGAFADEFPVGTSGIAADASPCHAS